jgi:hypothetical protein
MDVPSNFDGFCQITRASKNVPYEWVVDASDAPCEWIDDYHTCPRYSECQRWREDENDRIWKAKLDAWAAKGDDDT